MSRAWYKEIQRHQSVTEIHGRPTALMNSCKAMMRSARSSRGIDNATRPRSSHSMSYLHHRRIEAAIHNYP
jgi:hypothetical protein